MGCRTVHQRDTATAYVTSVGNDQLHITASIAGLSVDPVAAAQDVYGQVADALSRARMQIVHERVFGSLSARPAVLQARDEMMRRHGAEPELPITFVQGRPLWGEGLAGIHVHALRPPEPEDRIWTIKDKGAVCGHGWTRHGTTFLLLQNIHGRGGAAQGPTGRAGEAERMFERARRILEQNGADYRHVVRTWIYLADILEWYGEFNKVRNAKYTEYDLFGDGLSEGPWLPASTGIGGDNPLGAACVMDVLAAIPDAPLDVEPMSNVKQKEAFQYGSAFSRAMCVREPDVTHLMVSGTAAIDEQGRSLHPGDPQAQIRQTIDAVGALIAQKGARLQDICKATVFLKRPEDARVYHQVAAAYGLAQMPAVVVVADACRDELLFEIDALAEFATGTP